MNVKDLTVDVIEVLGQRDVRCYRFSGGLRRWPWDSPAVHLDTCAIKQLGCTARIPVEHGVQYLHNNAWLLARG
jgi:hypothetical protein